MRIARSITLMVVVLAVTAFNSGCMDRLVGEGVGAVIDNPEEHSRAWKLMCDKFPFYESFTDAVANLKMYRITPTHIRWIDNSQSFGHKEEFTLDGR